MQICSHFYLIYQLVVLMIYNRRRNIQALYMIRFISTWEHFDTKLNITILKEPGTHKAVHISLLAVSTTYDVTRETERRI